MSRRNIAIIFNPAAGHGRRRRLRRILDELVQLGCAVIVRETETSGHAEALARVLDRVDTDLVVAAGGDGTINEVLNGLHPGSPPLAVLPLGTANVLASEIGLPYEPRRLAELIVSGPVRAMWPGVINSRRFAMMAGIGFDARVVHDVSLALKRHLGRYAYMLNAARRLTHEIPPHFMVEIEGVRHKAASVIISRGRYYGGRFLLVPTASIFEPQLDVLMFPRARPMDVLRVGVALARGRLAGESNARLVRTREVRVEGPVGEPVQCDGNIFCTLPAQITVAASPVDLVTPQEQLAKPGSGIFYSGDT